MKKRPREESDIIDSIKTQIEELFEKPEALKMLYFNLKKLKYILSDKELNECTDLTKEGDDQLLEEWFAEFNQYDKFSKILESTLNDIKSSKINFTQFFNFITKDDTKEHESELSCLKNLLLHYTNEEASANKSIQKEMNISYLGEPLLNWDNNPLYVLPESI